MNRKRNDTAECVRSVALRLLEDEGPAAVTMRRVAQAVGITPMAIYHHFPNREALLRTVTQNEFEKLRSLIEALKLRGSAENRLVVTMQGYVDYALARPRIFDYVFSSVRPEAWRMRREWARPDCHRR